MEEPEAIYELLGAAREAERALSFVIAGEDARPQRWRIPGCGIRADARDRLRSAIAAIEAVEGAEKHEGESDG